jgi:two-component system response regulator DevR
MESEVRNDVARGRRAPQARTRVVVADKGAITRAGIRAILERSASIAVVGEANTYDSALEAVGEHGPDVFVVDLDLGDDTTRGLKLCADIAEQLPTTRILVLASTISEMIIVEALRRGATGYLIKDTTSTDELIKAVRAVQDGEIAFGHGVGALVAKTFITVKPNNEKLSEREIEVVRFAARGLGNKQIAHALFISESTVKFHIHNASIKLHASKRAEIVHRATTAGLI